MNVSTRIVGTFACGVVTHTSHATNDASTKVLLTFTCRGAVFFFGTCYAVTKVFFTLTINTSFICVTRYTIASCDALTATAEFVAFAGNAGTRIVFTLGLLASFTFGATEGVTVVFATEVLVTNVACGTSRVAVVSVTIAVLAVLIPRGASNVDTKIIVAIACFGVTNTACATGHRATFILDTLACFANFGILTTHAIAKILLTFTIDTDFTLGTVYTFTRGDTLAATAIFVCVTSNAFARIGYTVTAITNLA